MNTHESYVSLETAKLLKESGFDWEVDTCYTYGDYFDSLPRPKNCNEIEHWYSAPTLSTAQRWLREVKDVEVNVLCVYIGDNKKYSYVVFRGKYNRETINEGFDTYEEAQEAGIKKILELILEKGE